MTKSTGKFRSETLVAIDAVMRALTIARRGVGPEDIITKGGRDLVTVADVAVEDAVRRIVADSLGSSVIGEERGGEASAEGSPHWLVDPICGTRNFASGIPLYLFTAASGRYARHHARRARRSHRVRRRAPALRRTGRRIRGRGGLVQVLRHGSVRPAGRADRGPTPACGWTWRVWPLALVTERRALILPAGQITVPQLNRPSVLRALIPDLHSKGSPSPSKRTDALGENSRRVMLEGTDPEPQEEPMTALTRIALLAVFASFAGCASAGPPKPDAIFRHPTTGEVQWCDKGGVGIAGKVLFGSMVMAAQGAVYNECKTKWETKGYSRLDSTAKLSVEDQQRYETDLERMTKERADSIRPK